MDRIDHLRLSALAPLRVDDTNVIHSSAELMITDNPAFTLRQIAVWPDSVASVSERISSRFAAQPGRWRSLLREGETVLWIEPLKFWQIGGEAPSMPPQDGFVLDLTDSRTWIRISGTEARAVLATRLPIDLRADKFAPGAVASTALHGAGVTVWRSSAGYELFLPRSFSRSLVELMLYRRNGRHDGGFVVGQAFERK